MGKDTLAQGQEIGFLLGRKKLISFSSLQITKFKKAFYKGRGGGEQISLEAKLSFEKLIWFCHQNISEHGRRAIERVLESFSSLLQRMFFSYCCFTCSCRLNTQILVTRCCIVQAHIILNYKNKL